ncbi:hypothetical protein GDO81_029633 [Engystomops pustulosus]|uniref:Uncharacterized protein n=1 Tax=Engystomops pustulosus TaxID=76066 RepID=A0AAV6ZW24_ENGPU|nr:hypothetical protein GDO81_029633 [Engystomops pustulosus]
MTAHAAACRRGQLIRVPRSCFKLPSLPLCSIYQQLPDYQCSYLFGFIKYELAVKLFPFDERIRAEVGSCALSAAYINLGTCICSDITD